MWFLACHGGAGTSLLTRVYARHQARNAGRVWPLAQPPAPKSRVLLVARTDHRGLRSAQAAAQQWAAGYAPGVDLLGLVLIADAPGKLPKPLAELAGLVAGGVPRTWRVPWVEDTRFGALPQPDHPALRDLTSNLAALLNGATTR